MNPDIQTFAIAALILRIISSGFFGYVLIRQIKLRLSKFDDNLNHFRELLILVTLAPLLYNFLTIYNNIARATTGEQNEAINAYTFLLGAVAALITSIGFYLFYRGPRK